MEQKGAEGLTFAALAKRSGLSGSTLVQRFGTKQDLVRAAMVHAWEGLENRTRRIAREEPKSPEGAVAILSRLSEDYGDIESYADKLHLLREDLRDSEFRARGAAWVTSLAEQIEACFVQTQHAPFGIGTLMIAQWQGALLLWGFSPDEPLSGFIRGHLEIFLRSQNLGNAQP